jgi:hypothetical protein
MLGLLCPRTFRAPVAVPDLGIHTAQDHSPSSAEAAAHRGASSPTSPSIADQIGVAGVSRVLLDHVFEESAQRWDLGPRRARGRPIQPAAG